MNSVLKIKSEELDKAANLLYDRSLYVGVAHSAYYSCFQLMKHIWLYSMNRTEGEILRLKSDTHRFLITEVGKYVKEINPDDLHIFNTINRLKTLRIHADYFDEYFTKAQSRKALKTAKKILLILKKY
jgi:uncharacterized protein (UPF0332 family)